MRIVAHDDDDGMTAARMPIDPGYEREEDLVVALVAREPDAWRQLFDAQYDRVHRYAYMRTGNASDADDVASATFAAAARGIARYEFRGSPIAAWLFRIAHHETADLLGRRARARTMPIDEPATASVLAARDEIGPADVRLDIAGALGKLKPEHRDVLMLRLVEGRSVAEVAAILSKTDGAVKMMQVRALQAMQRALGLKKSKERA